MKIFIAGHKGLVGSALIWHLKLKGILDSQIVTRDKSQLDLTDQRSTLEFFNAECFDQVYFCAARVGGILANNNFPAEMIYQNLLMEANVIHGSHSSGVNKLLNIGSTCIYPKITLQPIPETALLTGQLEPTNEPYAVAKIAGIKMCESYNRQYGRDYRTVLPSNLYGPNDSFNLENGHVGPSLIRKIHEAKMQNNPTLHVWGTGKARREFLYIDDMAAGCYDVMNADVTDYNRITSPMSSFVNLGYGQDIEIKEFVSIAVDVIGFKGNILYDTSKPDGTLRKCTDSSKIMSLGWRPQIELREGIQRTYNWYLDHLDTMPAHRK
jgi:GDP-L-fucose synthase